MELTQEDIMRITEANLLRSEIPKVFIRSITPMLRAHGVMVSPFALHGSKPYIFYVDVLARPISEPVAELAKKFRDEVGAFINFPEGLVTWESDTVLKMIALKALKPSIFVVE